MTYDPTTQSIFVAIGGSDVVTVVNASGNQVVGNITVGPYPNSVGYDSANGLVYATDEGAYALNNTNSHEVSVIDPATDSMVNSFTVGLSPSSATFDPANNYLYISNGGDSVNSLSVVNTSTYNTLLNLHLAVGSGATAYCPTTGNIYSTAYAAGGPSILTEISSANQSFVANVSVGNAAIAVACDPQNGDLYVTNANSGNVSVISAETMTSVASIPVNEAVWGDSYDAQGNLILVANSNSDTVSLISPVDNTVLTTIPVGWYPEDILEDPANQIIYESQSIRGGAGELNYSSPPSVEGFNVTPGSPTANTSMTLIVSTNGGLLPFSYKYSGLPPGCASSDSPTIRCTPSSTGNFTVTVQVTDVANRTTFANLSIDVTTSTPTPTLDAVSVSPSSASVSANSTVVFQASPECAGGSCPPGATFSWSLANASGSLNTTTGDSVTFTAGPRAGSDEIFVNGTLSLETQAASPVLVTITSATTHSMPPPKSSNNGSSGFLGLPGNDGLLVVGAVAALVVIAAVVVAVWRSKRPKS